MRYKPNGEDPNKYRQEGMRIIEEGQSTEKTEEQFLKPHSEIYKDFLKMFQIIDIDSTIDYFNKASEEKISTAEYSAAKQALMEKILEILNNRAGFKSNRLERKIKPELDI